MAITGWSRRNNSTEPILEGGAMAVGQRGTCAILLALGAGNGLYASILGTPHAEFRQTYSLAPNGRVVIRNLYGDVSITGWDRDEVRVDAIKRSADPKHR